MKEENKSSICEIKSEAAATLLLRDKTRRFLAPFVGTRKSVKEASKQLGVNLSSFYPYVKQFERVGLIEVVEIVPRAGRPVKFYQTVADEFFIPHTLSPLLVYLEELQRVNHNTLWQATLRAWSASTAEISTWGFRFYSDPEIGFTAMGARSESEPWNLFEGEEPILLPYWRKLKLSREKARALQLELYGVLERYTAAQSESEDYLVRVAMAPLSNAGIKKIG